MGSCSSIRRRLCRLGPSGWGGKGSVEEEDTDELFTRHLQRLSDDTAKNTPFYHDPVRAESDLRPTRSRKLWFMWGAAAVAACMAIVYLRNGVRSPASAPPASGNFVSTKNGSKSK